jgi:hypothetical protein
LFGALTHHSIKAIRRKDGIGASSSMHCFRSVVTEVPRVNQRIDVKSHDMEAKRRIRGFSLTGFGAERSAQAIDKNRKR